MGSRELDRSCPERVKRCLCKDDTLRDMGPDAGGVKRKEDEKTIDLANSRMKFPFTFRRSSRRSFNLSSSETSLDQVGLSGNAPRPSYRAFIEHQPDPRLPPTSYTPRSSETPPPLPTTPPPFAPTSLPPLPATPPPSPPPYSEKPTPLPYQSKTTNESDEAVQNGQANMGCVTSKPDVETGEKNLSCHDGQATILIPAAEVSLNLKGCKNIDVEIKHATLEKGCLEGYVDKREEKSQTIIESQSIQIQDTREINVKELSFEVSQVSEDSVKENEFEAEDLTTRIAAEEPLKETTLESENEVVINGDCGETVIENPGMPEPRSDEVTDEVEIREVGVYDKVVRVDKQLEDDEPKMMKLVLPEESGGSAIPNMKKQGVSAESSRTKVKSAKEIQITRFEKDATSRELIRRGLQENEFLNFGLDSEAIVEAVVDAMFLKNVPSGSCVIKEGEAGSELYVCAKGTFDVFKGTEKVNTLGPGKVFGELAVLYHSKRNATIVATSDCSLWVLDRRVFHRIMMKAGMQREEEHIRFLRSVPLLRTLDKTSLIKMSDLLKTEYFNPGVDIVRQGDEGSKFYIITLGKVKVTARTPDGVTELTLGRGDFFGERALLNDDVRKATVTALDSGTECLVLDRKPFMELLGSVKELQLAAGIKEARPSDTKLVSEYDHIKLSDLSVVGTLGVGGFGRVEFVRSKTESRTFALKCIKKVVILEQQQQEHIFNEKEIMLACRSPFIARLYKTYHDRKYLYLLMEVCMGGDVWTLLQRHRLFEESTARFMTACVIEGLEYLHTRGIVYRDLKPENMMLDATGYIKLVDFGFAKKIGMGSKTWTFAGTPEYLAPEIVRNKGHDRAADYWSLGIFVHELLAGKPPFRGHDHHKTYNLILKGIDYVNFPAFIQKPAAMLIRKLCRPLPTDRLGYQKDGIMGIKNHRWFNGFDWEALQSTEMPAPIVPRLKGPEDLSNFEKYPKDKEIPPDEISGWDAEF